MTHKEKCIYGLIHPDDPDYIDYGMTREEYEDIRDYYKDLSYRLSKDL